jgi:hypothetical protein
MTCDFSGGEQQIKQQREIAAPGLGERGCLTDGAYGAFGGGSQNQDIQFLHLIILAEQPLATSSSYTVACQIPTLVEFAARYPRYGNFAANEGRFLFDLLMTPDSFFAAEVATVDLDRPAIAGVAKRVPKQQEHRARRPDALGNERGVDTPEERRSEQALLVPRATRRLGCRPLRDSPEVRSRNWF